MLGSGYLGYAIFVLKYELISMNDILAEVLIKYPIISGMLYVLGWVYFMNYNRSFKVRLINWNVVHYVLAGK